jgi:hypothetical protein
MTGIGNDIKAALCGAALALSVAGQAGATGEPAETLSWAFQAGVMTNGRAPDAVQPGRVDLVDHYMLGFILGYNRRIADTRFSFGVELQANAHLGSQDFYEVVLPVSLRYHPEASWWDAFDSVAFGLGYSQYSEISELERENYDGMSRKGLIYWFLEVEFAELEQGDNLFLRLHHRSNGYGTVEPNGGSNAWLLGFRRAF